MSYHITRGLMPNALRQHCASIFKGWNLQQILEDETITLSQNDTNHSVTQCHIPGEWKPPLHCYVSLKTIYFWVRTAAVNTCFNNYSHTVRFWVLIAVFIKMYVFWDVTLSLGKHVTTYPMTKCNILEDLNFQIDTVFIFMTLCNILSLILCLIISCLWWL